MTQPDPPRENRDTRRRAFWTMIGHESAKAVITVILIGGIAAILFPFINSQIEAWVKAQAAAVAGCDRPQNLKLLTGVTATSDSEMKYEAPAGTIHEYPASNLVDGSRDSAWVAADESAKRGAGSAITLQLPQEEDVRLICVLNGYANGSNWQDNGSVRVLRVTTDQGDRDAALPALKASNAFTYQPLSFPQGVTKRIHLEVKVSDGAQQYPPPPHVSATMSEIEVWVAR
jgi:hypothetical protein